MIENIQDKFTPDEKIEIAYKIKPITLILHLKKILRLKLNVDGLTTIIIVILWY